MYFTKLYFEKVTGKVAFRLCDTVTTLLETFNKSPSSHLWFSCDLCRLACYAECFFFYICSNVIWRLCFLLSAGVGCHNAGPVLRFHDPWPIPSCCVCRRLQLRWCAGISQRWTLHASTHTHTKEHKGSHTHVKRNDEAVLLKCPRKKALTMNLQLVMFPIRNAWLILE